MNENQWLSYILFSCPYKLTSKDKLVATYLTFVPLEEMMHKAPKNLAQIISHQSGLAVRTIQKSLGRLVTIGAVTFVTDAHFILEDRDAIN